MVWELEVYLVDEKNSKINKMNISQLKELLADFSDDIKFEYDLKKKIGLILEEKQRYIIMLIT